MNRPALTKHAAARSQQRGLSQLQIDLLVQFGSAEPAGDGATKLYLNNCARKRIRSYAGQLAGVLEQHLDIYVVVSAKGEVITVAHRLERTRRH